MKKRNVLWSFGIIMMLMASLVFSSCGDDGDDSENKPTWEEKFIGKWKLNYFTIENGSKAGIYYGKDYNFMIGFGQNSKGGSYDLLGQQTFKWTVINDSEYKAVYEDGSEIDYKYNFLTYEADCIIIRFQVDEGGIPINIVYNYSRVE